MSDKEGGRVPTIKKSLRIEEATAGRVAALQAEGESEAAAYARIISAGLEALEGAGSREEAVTGDQSALVRSLSEHIDTLKAANEELSGQLAIKDRHIETLTEITKAAQALEGMAHKQLAEPSTGDVIDVPERAQEAESLGSQEEPKRRGLFARLFG